MKQKVRHFCLRTATDAVTTYEIRRRDGFLFAVRTMRANRLIWRHQQGRRGSTGPQNVLSEQNRIGFGVVCQEILIQSDLVNPLDFTIHTGQGFYLIAFPQCLNWQVTELGGDATVSLKSGQIPAEIP